MQGREAEVWARLDRVTDPELDEPVTDMGFIEAVTVDRDGGVEVTFRLPTYWCSPNFAFLMAEDIRGAILALPWAARATVRLEDHLAGEALAAAVNAGRGIADALPGEAGDGDLSALREKFARKAFQRRQEAVLLGLRGQGFEPGGIAAMTLGQLDLVGFEEPEPARQLPRYREAMLARGLARGLGDPAFPDPDGRPLTAEGFAERIGTLRAVRINMEFGATLCRGLKRSRYAAPGEPGVETGPVPGAEPTLADFIAGRVPLRPRPD